jgi:tricorn protease
MSRQGYYQKPTLHQDRVVFVCEDDLWEVPAGGGRARRLTANPGRVNDPWFSPDGRHLAFTGRDEGHTEVHLMDADGGESRRLTYLGADTVVAGWTPDGSRVLFATNHGQPFKGLRVLGKVAVEGGPVEMLPWGPASSITFGPSGGVALGRYTGDPARWKRYRGGTVGQLWVDPEGSGQFRPLIETGGNVTRPLWVGQRIWFASDHEGVANLYSCTPEGLDLRRHTHHTDFYVRHPQTDGRRIVYQCGADLYLFEDGASRKIEIDFPSPRTYTLRRFVKASEFFEDYDLHPQGHSLVLTVRGRPFTMANWEQGVLQHGQADGVRYRLCRWLADGQRVVCVSDAAGEERLEVYGGSDPEPVVVDPGDFDMGRPVSLEPAPVGTRLALTNHRHELILVDLESRQFRCLDRSPFDRIAGTAWSPDGRWLAYAWPGGASSIGLKICRVEDGQIFQVTPSEFRDFAPAFDPLGRYLYFLSTREFDPVYDQVHFDLGFPRGTRPCLVTLRRDLPSPFVPEPRPPGDSDSEKPGGSGKKEPEESSGVGESSGEGPAAPEEGPAPVEIDFEGIERRVLAFPVPEGRYGQIAGAADQVFFTCFPIEGSLASPWPPPKEPPARGTLMVYNFKTQEKKDALGRITHMRLTRDGKILAYRSGNRLRVVPTSKLEESSEGPGRKSGYVDLERVRPSVRPRAEWRQMYREAWRLMRDHFWSPDMAGVDWERVYRQYEPLLERIGSRSEFSDLLWEVQGELGTSHAYEFGGDYPPQPEYDLGLLGADLEYDAEADAWRLAHIVRGDSWEPRHRSPLERPGLDIGEGDLLLAIGGRPVSRDLSPGQLLVHQAGQEVQLTLRRGQGEPRRVWVRTLRDETPLRYREWVEGNRRRVHEATEGRVGYLHIPNMGPLGYAEFHRGFLQEFDRQGLVVDVRYNGGGHVSGLLLEKLARRRLGYDISRWGSPLPYPLEAPRGPMVALTNESAGSDGDIFCHAFKLLKLGPLVGKRTWGGVIGIWPRHRLVDGSLTTQPEFAFWFEDVGWGVENYGTDPDVRVEIAPQDYAAGRDPQLDKAIELILEILATHPPAPAEPARPDQGRPRLRPDEP